MVLPHPVSPVTSTTLECLHDSSSLDKKSARAFHAGSDFRWRSIDLLQQKDVAGGACFGGVDQKALRFLGRFFMELPVDIFFDAVGFVDADGGGAVGAAADGDDEALPIGFGTDVDANGKRGRSSRVCNRFCSSP